MRRRNGRRMLLTVVVVVLDGVTSELGASVLEPNLRQKQIGII